MYVPLAWKVARWSRSQGIRCTGRGSAADSCVAYALLLTDVDVIQRDLPFARFLESLRANRDSINGQGAAHDHAPATKARKRAAVRSRERA